MEEYLRNMKSLRSQMNGNQQNTYSCCFFIFTIQTLCIPEIGSKSNDVRRSLADFEEEASTVSVEQQKQITAIQAIEKDLQSVKLETKRLKDETQDIVKTKGQLCCQILEKQNKISTLQVESTTLAQTLELIQQERSALSEKMIEKSAYYKKVKEDLNAKLQAIQKLLNTRKAACQKVKENYGRPTKGNVDMVYTHDSNFEKGVECNPRAELKSSLAKIDELSKGKSEIVAKTSEINQIIEQLNLKIDGFPVEIKSMDANTLEKEHQEVLAEKAGELEYLQSLKEQIEQMQRISEEVKCKCGEEYSVDLKGHGFGLSEMLG